MAEMDLPMPIGVMAPASVRQTVELAFIMSSRVSAGSASLRAL